MSQDSERKPVRATVSALGAALLTALAGIAYADGRPQAAAGTYEGTPNGTGSPNRGAGCFEQKPTVFGKRVKPADDKRTPCRDQIIAPSLGPLVGARKGCNREPAALDAGGFPIHEARFHYKGRARIGPHHRSLVVDFRGRWVTRTKVVGATRISGGGCASLVKWTMSTPPRS